MNFLTTEEVASLLNISDRTVRELINTRTRTGEPRVNPLPCFRLSSRIVRFDRESVLQWAASHNPSHKSDSVPS